MSSRRAHREGWPRLARPLTGTNAGVQSAALAAGVGASWSPRAGSRGRSDGNRRCRHTPRSHALQAPVASCEQILARAQMPYGPACSPHVVIPHRGSGQMVFRIRPEVFPRPSVTVRECGRLEGPQVDARRTIARWRQRTSPPKFCREQVAGRSARSRRRRSARVCGVAHRRPRFNFPYNLLLQGLSIWQAGADAAWRDADQATPTRRNHRQVPTVSRAGRSETTRRGVAATRRRYSDHWSSRTRFARSGDIGGDAQHQDAGRL